MPNPATRATPLRDLIRPYLTTPTSAATIAELTGKTRDNVGQTIHQWRKSDPDNAPRIGAWDRGAGGPHTPLFVLDPKRKHDAKRLKKLTRSEVSRRWRVKNAAEIRISERAARASHRKATWILPLLLSQSTAACTNPHP